MNKGKCKGINTQKEVENMAKKVVDNLKADYIGMIAKEVWTGNDHMIDYERKNIDEVVELDNGDLIGIETPRIETRFCFGYGYCGVSTDEDYKNAEEMRRYAQESEDYFLNENLKGLNGMIEDLQDDNLYFYKFVKYTGCKDDSSIKDIRWCRLGYTPEYEPWRWSNLRGLKELTEDERKKLIVGYQNVKAKFEKRLRTYLKRYGTKKLTTWTFLSD